MHIDLYKLQSNAVARLIWCLTLTVPLILLTTITNIVNVMKCDKVSIMVSFALLHNQQDYQ